MNDKLDKNEINEVRWRVNNKSNSKYKLYIEPWGEHYEVPAKSYVTVTFIPIANGLLESEFIDSESFAIWGATPMRIRVFNSSGLELTPPR